jgi:ribosomal protein L11 methyltransferase
MESGRRTLRVGGARVRLGPGKAFGSGEHETTRSCLRVLERLPAVEGAAVLDVGCGTGVLGIAALKLGARSVVAFDTDLDALETTRANADLNGVSGHIALFLGEIRSLRNARFHLILANLYGDLLLASMGSLASLLTLEGHLLMSGIRWEDRFELEQSVEREGLSVRKVLMLTEYVTVLARAGCD